MSFCNRTTSLIAALALSVPLLCGTMPYRVEAQSSPAAVEQLQATILLRNAVACTVPDYFSAWCDWEDKKCLQKHVLQQSIGEATDRLTTSRKAYEETITVSRKTVITETSDKQSVLYKDLDSSRVAFGKTLVTDRTTVVFRCKSGACIDHQWEMVEDGKKTLNREKKAEAAIAFCNWDAADDAKLAIETLIKLSN